MNLDKLIESLTDSEISYIKAKLNTHVSKKTLVSEFLETYKKELSARLMSGINNVTMMVNNDGYRPVREKLQYIDDISVRNMETSRFIGTKTIYEFFIFLKKHNMEIIIQNGQFNQCEYLKKYTQYSL